MKDIMTFRRVEKKYRLTPEKRIQLMRLIGPRLTPDAHGRSTICSLYLDTPDFRIIRASIDAKDYKEKLRLRSYGTPALEDSVFLEIKKKYRGVVYKRREIMTLREAMAFIRQGVKPRDTQIIREIGYALSFYHHPQPAMLVCYERDAFFDAKNPQLRITFDMNVRARETELGLEYGPHGSLLLPEDTTLLEIKTDGAMPVWLAQALSDCAILPTSFSKYGTAYLRGVTATVSALKPALKGDIIPHACTV